MNKREYNDESEESDYDPNKKMRSFKKTDDMTIPEQVIIKKIKPLDPFTDYIKSYFFTKSIIDEYSLRIASQLNNNIIINLDDINEYFKDIGTSAYYVANILIQDIIRENICSGIDTTYISRVLTKVIEQPHNNRNYDIVFIIDPSRQKDINCILSLAITQKKECVKFEQAYALNLICSRKCFNCGNILIGLYLYSILCHPKITTISRIIVPSQIPIQIDNIPFPYYGEPILHVGLLEISGGYMNASGLCLYTKFGFKVAPELYGSLSGCFNTGGETNIAMIKRFKSDDIITTRNEISNIVSELYDIDSEKDKIIQIVKKENPGYTKHIICEFTNRYVQQKLGELYYYLNKANKKYSELMIQSKWPINNNKERTGYTEEFSTKMKSVEDELQIIQYNIDLIESSKRDITLQELGISGGKKLKKTKKTIKKYKKAKTNKRRKKTKQFTKNHFYN